MTIEAKKAAGNDPCQCPATDWRYVYGIEIWKEVYGTNQQGELIVGGGGVDWWGQTLEIENSSYLLCRNCNETFPAPEDDNIEWE